MAVVQRRRNVGPTVAALAVLALLLLAAPLARAHNRAAKEKENGPAWYERIQLRGYTQVRYNRLGATNPHLKSDQGDKSVGEPGGIFVRRARLILFGEMTSLLGIYLQPDFASAISDSLNVGQLRDWWTEIYLNEAKEFRIRVGQQKVPFGWELMQSSQNRLPFDRTDAMNSAFVNERDLGAFFMYEPASVRKRFRHLVDSGLKGSGDYGFATAGISNGQPLNTREKNDNKHFFARLAYPFDIGSQTIELAAGGYTGLFVPTLGEGITNSRKEYRDLRLHGTFVLYPKPFGLQAEYNAGIGPELDGKVVRDRGLAGGYVMAMWRQKIGTHHLTPYVRLHKYDGGKKFEQNAPRHRVEEINAGLEWQIARWLEITGEYMGSDRTINEKRETGKLFRLQVQFNY